jgi:hypothetical protein
MNPFKLFGKPRSGRGTNGGTCNLAISGTFPNYTSGAAYSGTVTLTGGTPPFTVELITESTPGSGGGGTPGGGQIGGGGGGQINGALLNGYVGAPYVLLPEFKEGLSLVKPDPNNYWTLSRSSGLPDNVTPTAGLIFAGTPTSAGTFNWSISANQWGFPSVTLAGTMTILASPSTTVWNSADRQVSYSTVRFLAGPAPFLQVEGLSAADDPGLGGYVRALNGYTTGKRYWEVRVDAVPTASGEALSIGIDRSSNGDPAAGGGIGGNTQVIGSNPNSGEWGYVMNVIGGSPQSYVAGRGMVGVTAPAVVAGSVVRIFHDADANRAWIGIAGQGWIGGGDPVAGTNPTIPSLTPEASPRWPDYRPLVILRGAGVRITANFGSQSWLGGGPPAGGVTIPFAQQPFFSHQVFDLDTATFDSGTQEGGVQIFAPTARVDDTRARGTAVNSRLMAAAANPHSVRGSLPKSTGKWHVEFEMTGFADRTTAGLAPDNWVTTTLPRPGWTADSFGVTRGGDPAGGTAGVVRNANVDVGVIAASGNTPLVITLACDFDASPKTVQVLRNGVSVGTYNLPNTGRPWAPVAGVAPQGQMAMRTTDLVYPQSGFTNWGP